MTENLNPVPGAIVLDKYRVVELVGEGGMAHIVAG